MTLSFFAHAPVYFHERPRPSLRVWAYRCAELMAIIVLFALVLAWCGFLGMVMWGAR